MHLRVRTLLLARELINKPNRSVGLYLGEPIAFDRLKNLSDDGELIG